MLTRREMLFGALAATLMARPAWSHQRVPQIDPPQLVEFRRGFEPGTIVIESRARLLHLVEAGQMARRYMIGVGRIGLGWSGRRVVGRKAEWPSWRPTDRMIRREPEKYARYAAGVAGGPKNPLGARALYLYHDGHDTYYRIHGTNEPWTIGRAVSNGCFRLLNEHVIDLYDRVPVGTPVVVIG
jgi:lipoprotein-anchoring transpeptidase ErfK/SrfK